MSRVFYMLLIYTSLLNNVNSSINDPVINEKFRKKNNTLIFKKLKPLQSDRVFGKHLKIFLKDLKRNKLNKGKVKKLILLSRISFSFKTYELILKEAKKISTLNKKNNEFFHKTCSLEKKYSYPIFNTISKLLKSFCNNLFIKMAYSSENSFLLKKNNFDYLSKNLESYLEGSNQKLFSKTLKKISKEPNVYTFLSNLVVSHAKKKELKINNNILKSLKPESLQSIENLKNHNQEYETLKRLKKNQLRKSFKEIDKSFKLFKFEKSKNLVIDTLSFYLKNKDVISNKYAWKKFTGIGKKFLYESHYDFATSIFQTSNIFNPIKDESESLFLILWTHLLRKDYRGAQNFILKENLIENFHKISTKLKFWVAVSLKENGEKALAKTLYKDIITSNPLSFYSIISLKELNKSSKKNKEDQLVSKNIFSMDKQLNINQFKLTFINSLRRLLIWLSFKDYKLEEQEINFLTNLSPKDVYKNPKEISITKKDHERLLFTEVVKLFSNKGEYLRSFKMIHKSLTFKKFLLNHHYLKILFPFEYFNEIKKIEKVIDPIVILSLIRQESAFNPQAISRVGARGLMQIMPSTAKSMEKKVTNFQLKNPNLNLKLGIRYFKMLLSKYKGNLIYTLAAYNAGEKRIENWKRKIFNSEDPLSIIESIPFKETRNYVKLIYRNIFFYKWLEKKSNLSVPLRDSFFITFKSTH